jgi:hypothetical protein
MNIQDALLRGLVPAGRLDAGVPRPVTEADFTRSYIGYSDLFGGQPTWDTFFERLQDLGLQPTMAALSFLNSWLYLKGGIQAQAEMIGLAVHRVLARREGDGALRSHLGRARPYHLRVSTPTPGVSTGSTTIRSRSEYSMPGAAAPPLTPPPRRAGFGFWRRPAGKHHCRINWGRGPGFPTSARRASHALYDSE